jgi:integrase/recombinase XerD
MPDMSAVLSLATRQAFDLEETLKLFLSELAPNTQKKYRFALEHFSNWLADHNLNILSCDELSALTYLNYYAESPAQKFKHRLQNDKISRYTVSQRAMVLHSLYKFLMRYGVTERDPIVPSLDKFKKAKSGDRRQTEMIPFDKVKTILDIPSPYIDEGLRDRCFLGLLFGCGLRISEVLSLLCCDIKQTVEGCHYLELRHTKAQRIQQQPMPPWLADRVTKYLAVRINKEHATQSEPLLMSYRKYGGLAGNLTTSTAYRLFREYCRQAGLNAGALSPHSARATAITKLLSANDMSYREVQEFARHGSVGMVQVYDKRRYNLENSPGLKLSY